MAGLVNPAAIQVAEQGWFVLMQQYKGCFGSDCPLQVTYLVVPSPHLHVLRMLCWFVYNENSAVLYASVAWHLFGITGCATSCSMQHNIKDHTTPPMVVTKQGHLPAGKLKLYSTASGLNTPAAQSHAHFLAIPAVALHQRQHC